MGTPRVSGVPGASPAPQVPWTPPASAVHEVAPRRHLRGMAAVPPDLGDRIHRLTLGEIVDIGLRNNAATRLAWANAQAAAAAYGSQRGERLPTIDGDVTATRLKTVASQGRTAVQQSVLSPSVTLSYLVFDFGGRGGRIEGARQQLLAAGFTHNAAIQDVVLQIQVAYFQYLANRSLLGAQRTTLAEAQANLEAAEERRRVGLATIADVLQARTAASQAQLDLQSTEGSRADDAGRPRAGARPSGQSAVRRRLRGRRAAGRARWPTAWTRSSPPRSRGGPDLAAARSEAEAARAGIGEARSSACSRRSTSRATGARTYATHDSQRRQQLQPLARTQPSRSSTASPGSTTSAPPSTRRRRPRPGPRPSGSRWSSRSSAPTTRCRRRRGACARPRT